jgi:hypothetical protein
MSKDRIGYFSELAIRGAFAMAVSPAPQPMSSIGENSEDYPGGSRICFAIPYSGPNTAPLCFQSEKDGDLNLVSKTPNNHVSFDAVKVGRGSKAYNHVRVEIEKCFGTQKGVVCKPKRLVGHIDVSSDGDMKVTPEDPYSSYLDIGING